MDVNYILEYFKQDPIASAWKFQDIKLGIVWRIYKRQPHEACFGGCENKNLNWLDEWLKNQKAIDRKSFVRDMGGLLILWRAVQPFIRIQDFQRRFFVPHVDIYSLAWLFHLTDYQIDLKNIWKNQKVGDSILDVLKPISQIVHTHILQNSRDLLCTEYTKRIECWEELITKDYILPMNIRSEYIFDPRYMVVGNILIGIN
jgi:hypothetical protein